MAAARNYLIFLQSKCHKNRAHRVFTLILAAVSGMLTNMEKRARPRFVLCALLASLPIGCGDDGANSPDAPSIDGPSGPPTLRFAPSTGAMAFGDVPYPGDLYRTAAGGIQMSTLPIGPDVLQR